MTVDKTKKNILFIIDVLGVGGAERVMVPILANLKDDFNIRVCVFRIKDGNPIAGDIRKLGVEVDYLPYYHLRDISALPRLIHYFRKHQPDLVHTQLEFADILGNFSAWTSLP